MLQKVIGRLVILSFTVFTLMLVWQAGVSGGDRQQFSHFRCQSVDAPLHDLDYRFFHHPLPSPLDDHNFSRRSTFLLHLYWDFDRPLGRSCGSTRIPLHSLSLERREGP